jgi:hypothetical protein
MQREYQKRQEKIGIYPSQCQTKSGSSKNLDKSIANAKIYAIYLA